MILTDRFSFVPGRLPMPTFSTLQPGAFSIMPTGAIRPAGWLADQLAIQADGLSGHLHEFWPDIAESGWIGGPAEAWERGPYWLQGIVPLAFQLDDTALKAEARRWVDAILDAQTDTGWFVPHRSDSRRPSRYPHDPWPATILMKALRSWFEATGDRRVPPAIVRFLTALAADLPTNPLRSWAAYRWQDLVVSIWWTHEQTGEGWLLDLADVVRSQGFDWRHHVARFPYPDKVLPEERDLRSHVVNNAMGLKAAAVMSRLDGITGDELAGIERLDHFHGQATGVFSGDEHLAGRFPSQGTELCAVVEYMASLEEIIAITGDVSLADRLERIAFNALPATISEDMWSHQYVQQVNQIACIVSEDRVYTSNGPDANIFGLEPHFGCCTANMHQGWPCFVQSLWMIGGDRRLTAISYAPCVLRHVIDGVDVTISVRGKYPFGDRVDIRVDTARPIAFERALRRPNWARSMTLRINGESIGGDDGTPCILNRTWSSGDTLHLEFARDLRIETDPDYGASLWWGPILLAMPIANAWHQIGRQLPAADWEVTPLEDWRVGVDLDALQTAERSPSFDAFRQAAAPFSRRRPPVRFRVPGFAVPGWCLDRHAAGPIPAPTTLTTGPDREITLVPYGCTDLRIARFPFRGTGALLD